jgi:hypothetical protein
MIGGLFVVIGIAALVLVAGIVVGMLLAPRITRWTERDDEEGDGRRD